jgi:hypothetical protein
MKNLLFDQKIFQLLHFPQLALSKLIHKAISIYQNDIWMRHIYDTNIIYSVYLFFLCSACAVAIKMSISFGTFNFTMARAGAEIPESSCNYHPPLFPSKIRISWSLEKTLMRSFPPKQNLQVWRSQLGRASAHKLQSLIFSSMRSTGNIRHQSADTVQQLIFNFLSARGWAAPLFIVPRLRRIVEWSGKRWFHLLITQSANL